MKGSWQPGELRWVLVVVEDGSGGGENDRKAELGGGRVHGGAELARRPTGGERHGGLLLPFIGGCGTSEGKASRPRRR